MLGTLQDITERKLAEARLQQEHGMRRKAEQELFDAHMLLAEAERMEIVGRLATGVAHEVKNPLAIIRLGIDYLSDHPPADDRSALVMADIRDSVGRADNVIKELLDFSRAKPLNRVAVRADSIVENAARLMRHELTRQNIEIVSRYDPSAGLILADSDRMVQVFINLLTNAAQAIGQDGRIEIVVRSLVVGEHELALLDRDFFALGDEAIVVEIADNGPGIPNENLGKLFEQIGRAHV